VTSNRDDAGTCKSVFIQFIDQFESESLKIDCGDDFPRDSTITFAFDMRRMAKITKLAVWCDVEIDEENECLIKDAWHLQYVTITDESTVNIFVF
jgi:hypothetical protein